MDWASGIPANATLAKPLSAGKTYPVSEFQPRFRL